MGRQLTHVAARENTERFGIKVTKTADLATVNQALFTVTGVVLFNLLWGEVTTVVATTTTYKLQLTTGTVDMCAATTITTDAVGTMYYFSGDAGAILSGTLAAGDIPVVGIAQLAGGPAAPMIVGLSPAGVNASNGIRHVIDGAGTGNIQWTLYYTALSVGAKVVAA